MVTIERMRWWHVEQLLPVEHEVFQPEPWSEQLFWSELGQLDTRHYVVALAADGIAGYAGLCDYPDEAFVQTIAVAPQAQGSGVGKLLLTELLEEAGRRRHRVVSLEVRADNLPAQRLYDRFGFARAGVRRGYYPGGVDALVLTRRS